MRGPPPRTKLISIGPEQGDTAMTDRDVLDRIAEAFRHEPRLGPGFKPSTMTLAADGTLTLAGEVDSIAAKKRALEIAVRPAEVRAVADRLHVAPRPG